MQTYSCVLMRMDGDYAVLCRADNGDEITVARALLPPQAEEGSRLLCEGLAFVMEE
ncbi:MAG: chorismate--pyruvate lyase [Eubacteriales bacterium]|nr:chorismate--pyruvate lyase [Eubacteriales bacterium]